MPQPLVIRRVEDRDGVVLYTATESSTYAVSDTTAFLMTTMMADVINAGTGAGARSLGFTLPAAGKTGTTNDFHDAWFVGFTPKLATGVWVGLESAADDSACRTNISRHRATEAVAGPGRSGRHS